MKLTKHLSFRYLNVSLFIINLYYSIRSFLTFINRREVLNIQSIIIIFGLFIFSSIISILAITNRLSNSVLKFLKKKNSIFAVYVFWVFISQVTIWLSSHIFTGIAFELRGWIIFHFLWAITYSLYFGISRIWPTGTLIHSHNQSQSRKYRNYYLIGIAIFSIAIIGLWIYKQWLTQLPIFYNYDPEFSYMLSSLTPFKDMKLYSRMDHPGTLMQLIGSLINGFLSILRIKQSGFPIYLAVYRPEFFVYLARAIILIFSIIVFCILALKSIQPRNINEIFAGLSVGLLYFSSHRLSTEFTGIYSPNSFNFIVGSFLLFILLISFSNNEMTKDRINIISIAAGIGATFHVYMLSLLIPILTAIIVENLIGKKNFKITIRYLSGALFNFLKGYIIGSLVIINQFSDFLDWLYNLLTHTGIYGYGDKGFLNISVITNNLINLITNFPELFLSIIGLSLVFIFVISKRNFDPLENRGPLAVNIGLLFQIIFLLFIIGKHPRGRYLLSVASIIPVFFAGIIKIMKSDNKIASFIFPAIFFVTLSSFVYLRIDEVHRHKINLKSIQTYQKEVDNFMDWYSEDLNIEVNEINKYWTYGSFSRCHSLWFGNEYAKNLFTDEVYEVCNENQEFSINIWSNKVIPYRTQQINSLNNQSVIIGTPDRLKTMEFNKFYEVSSFPEMNLSFFIPKSAD